jgi:hypothetical protein
MRKENGEEKGRGLLGIAADIFFGSTKLGGKISDALMMSALYDNPSNPLLDAAFIERIQKAQNQTAKLPSATSSEGTSKTGLSEPTANNIP